MESYDVLVVGGGIAGVSVGYALARRGARVLLAETEHALAYHTTGRSAAMFMETYGSEQTRRLAMASRAGFDEPPGVDRSLLTPRGFLVVGTADQAAELQELAAHDRALVEHVRFVGTDAVYDICPALRHESAAAGVWDSEAADIDVAALHQAYLSAMRRLGGEVRTSSPVSELVRIGPAWRGRVGPDHVLAERVVDAAGAWGDHVARLAGVPALKLQPMRRTAFTAALPGSWDSEVTRQWPMIQDLTDGWYFKPEGDGLLCSLSEENPSEPCDAKADQLDVALALERVNDATTLDLKHVRSSWAGLRTFAPDRDLVLGPDPAEESFSWYVGLGGSGIQTAPAAGETVAALTLGEQLPSEVAAAGVSVRQLSPGRFGG